MTIAVIGAGEACRRAVRAHLALQDADTDQPVVTYWEIAQVHRYA